MIKNYFKIAVRNILRYKGYSSINILGLSVGLACVMIISIIIKNEISFDRFHENKDRIYRVYIRGNNGGQVDESAPVMIPLAPAAKAEIPEIEEAVRTSKKSVLASFGTKKFFEQVLFVDEKFFEVFTFPLITGGKNYVLKNPRTIVISERIAKKYFGEENPLGKTLIFDNKDAFLIKGVINNIPDNSHLQGDIFASFNTYNESNFPRWNSWGQLSNDYTYLLLKQNINVELVEKKLNDVLHSKMDKEDYGRFTLKMQPLTDIHFSDLEKDDARTTPKILLYLYMAIAAFILLLAAINFINLTTARASRRHKEIGIRKVIGAKRSQLIKQFLSESFVITFISFIAALGIASILLALLNDLMKENYSLSVMLNGEFMLFMAAILVITSLLSGAYPAFILSRPIPMVVLRSGSLKKGGYSLRAILVVAQFAISIFLIIGTITVYKQVNFLLKKDLGFPSDKIVVVNVNDPDIKENGLAFKNELMKNQNICMASFSSGTPGSNLSSTSDFTPEGGNRDDELILQILDVDYDFLDTFGLKMVKGRYFSPAFTTDTSNAYIINEAAAKRFRGKDPLKTRIASGGGIDNDSKLIPIIGVMQNFNYRSLKNEVDPVVFRLRPSGGRFLAMQVSENDLHSTIEYIKRVTEAFSPAYPFKFFFTKDRFENYYNSEMVISKLLGSFSVIAILISCIGILGLVSFSTEQKSKEIGIRKVLGASVFGIVIILCKDFIKWVLISNIIAWPLAYLVMNKWLNGYAYRINFGYSIIVLTFIISLIITIVAVSFHTIKAAIANPVDSLKYE